MIFLEKIKEKDLNLIIEWKERSDVVKNKTKKFKPTMFNQKNWIEKITKDESCRYWIINNSGIKIGIIDLNHIDFENGACILEKYIADFHFRGREITPLILYNIYDYVFKDMKLNKILIYIVDLNDSEITKYINSGCEIIDPSTERSILESKFNVTCLRITKEKWQNIRENIEFEKIKIE